MIHPSVFIHPLANVESDVEIGEGTKVWQFATVRRGATVGADCIVGQGAFVDAGVFVGSRCKLENYASLHAGTRVEDEVFVGPGVIFTNDRWPKAATEQGGLKSEEDWTCEPVTAKRGCSIGAGAILLPGITVGEHAMIAAGAVVTKDVPSWTLVVGNPAVVRRKIKEP